MSGIPEGWTDDLTVRVAPDQTLDDLVEYVLDSERRSAPRSEIMQTLTTRFGLSFEDARLALDRVDGGRVRAATQVASNEPNPAKDPIAYISYHRAKGVPYQASKSADTDVWRRLIHKVKTGNLADALDYATSREFARDSNTHECEAATLWRRGMDASPEGTQPVRAPGAAVQLLALAEATSDANVSPTLLRNVLLQVGTAISTMGESRIDELGEQTYAPAGTPAWFDAIKLAEAAGRLSVLFRRIGDGANEAAALEVRGRVTTRMLGHCPHRVGAVMLDAARCAIRLGRVERAAGLCKSVIGDFARVVQACEGRGASPFDEDEIALRQLVEAIDLYSEIRGRDDNDIQSLRARCSALLQASSDSQASGDNRRAMSNAPLDREIIDRFFGG